MDCQRSKKNFQEPKCGRIGSAHMNKKHALHIALCATWTVGHIDWPLCSESQRSLHAKKDPLTKSQRSGPKVVRSRRPWEATKVLTHCQLPHEDWITTSYILVGSRVRGSLLRQDLVPHDSMSISSLLALGPKTYLVLGAHTLQIFGRCLKNLVITWVW